MKKPTITKAILRRRIIELEAQLASNYHFASASLHKAGSNLLGSAVIVELTFLGGNTVIDPVAICDGLSDETIAALRKDIVRSYEKAIEFKPFDRNKS